MVRVGEAKTQSPGAENCVVCFHVLSTSRSAPLNAPNRRGFREEKIVFEGEVHNAELSRARFLTRSSKTLDREHRWNNAGFERRGLSGGKNGKKNVFG
jgi:hypothetical protein